MEPRQPERLINNPAEQQASPRYEAPVSVEVGDRLPNPAEAGVDAGPARAEVAQIAMPAAPALPTPVISQQSTGASATSDDDSAAPLLASDDDLIEKEWVDKAKKILAETRDDPYKREYEISRLQIEYIRKRYGREIGQAED